MTDRSPMNRREFNKAVGAAGAVAALAPFGIARAQSTKLKIGVLLPRSGVQALIGQSCQRAAEIGPPLIKQMLGVDVEIMSGDTESNVDVARTRAERLIQEGANILVGAFDSGQTIAIAQVAEQRGVPLVVNIAAAPQITNQGYKFVSRIFITAPEIVTQGLSLMGDLFQATHTAPRTAVFMHVNDTFGQAVAGGVKAIKPKLTQLPFEIVETIPYDPAARDLAVEVAKAKASKADFLMLVCRLNDAIILRREMIRQRWNPMGIIGPGSPGMYEEQFSKVLGKAADYCITNNPWYNPKAPLTKTLEQAFLKEYPKDKFVYHGLNVGYTFEGLLVAADAFRRARTTDPGTLAVAVRQTDIQSRVMLGGPIKFNAKGQVEGNREAGVQIRDGIPRVFLPAEVAEVEPIFPMPGYKPS